MRGVCDSVLHALLLHPGSLLVAIAPVRPVQTRPWPWSSCLTLARPIRSTASGPPGNRASASTKTDGESSMGFSTTQRGGGRETRWGWPDGRGRGTAWPLWTRCLLGSAIS
ncbi:hypothetical protein LZ30DRAFT_241379 [Colletotrichum cereale]|nr:hypothetical protein LZ30DRAFT_241379 [Colletotrichum cereale]